MAIVKFEALGFVELAVPTELTIRAVAAVTASAAPTTIVRILTYPP